MSEVKITRLLPGPISPDLSFDRFQFDKAGMSPDVSRFDALANKDFAAPLFANGRRKKAAQAE